MKSHGRKSTPVNGVPASQAEGTDLHFRLCHLCFHLNEAESEITECSECQHIFKDDILTQFFDNNDTEAFTDANPDEVVEEAEEEDSDGEESTSDVNGLSVRF